MSSRQPVRVKCKVNKEGNRSEKDCGLNCVTLLPLGERSKTIDVICRSSASESATLPAEPHLARMTYRTLSSLNLHTPQSNVMSRIAADHIMVGWFKYVK